MAKQRHISKGSMSDLLRQAILDAPTYLGIERDTGVPRQCIMAFVKGKSTLRLDKADTLAEYFGIECKQTRRRGKRA
ncbi:MAG TPA: hypothetical protein PKI11_04765 [Candidatus Hydrogenedentes bacterium]|nr:hypothetical protein [Candidatus Hydrogenedentota bacterium]